MLLGERIYDSHVSMENIFRRVIVCITILGLSLAVTSFAKAAETGQVTVDWEALSNGNPGVRATIEVQLTASEKANLESETLTFKIDDLELRPLETVQYGETEQVSFFSKTSHWPDRQTLSAKTGTLYLGNKSIANVKLTAPIRGMQITPSSLLVKAPSSDATVTDRLRTHYEAVSDIDQRRRFQWIATTNLDDKAKAWFDLGQIAFRRQSFRRAAWFFHRSAENDLDDVLPQAFLAQSILKFTPHENELLEAVANNLAERIDAQYEKTASASETFEQDQNQAQSDVDVLSKEFDDIQKQLQDLEDQSDSNPKAKKLGARLLEINQEIEKLNQSLYVKIGDIERVTPFMTEALFNAQMALSRLPDMDEQLWLNKALNTSEAAYEQSFNPVDVDRTLRAQALLRSAARRHELSGPAEKAYRADPKLAKRETLETKYDAMSLELESDKETLEIKIAAIDDQADIQQLQKEKERLLAEFKTAQSNHEKNKQTLDGVKRAADEARSNGDIDEANRHIDKYNIELPKVNASADASNAKANLVEAADKSYVEAYNEAAKKLNAPYNTKISDFNTLAEQINTLSEGLKDKEQVYKDLIFNRDQDLALARDELYQALSAAPSAEIQNLIVASDEAINIPEDTERLYTSRPWCTNISYNCGSCFGLAVLGCEFGQMDAISACQAGERILPYSPSSFGSGGIIGTCRGLRPLDVNVSRWATPDGSRNAENLSPADEEERELAADAIADSLDPLFESDCGVSPSDSADESPDDGLILQFSEETLENIRKAREKWRKDREREFLLADMERRLSLVRNNQIFASDPDIKQFIDALQNDPDKFKDPLVQRALAEKIAARAEHVIQSTAAQGGTEDDWVKNAHKINDLAKDANKIISDLGGSLPQLEELTGYADNALDIIDGGREGDANKVLGGVRGLTASVPGPLNAVLEIPGRFVAGHVTHMSDTLKDEAAVMGTVAEIIGSGGSDPDVDRRLAEQIKAVEKNLDPKTFMEKMFIEPTKDFIKDKVPGGETLLNLFSRLTEDDGKSEGSCPVPPITIPLD